MLEVIDAGLHSSMQDHGRPGWGHLGVRYSGACDPLALAAANLLAGNAAGTPAVEMTLLGATFTVRHDLLLGLAGADMGAHVPQEDRSLVPGRSYRLRAGTTLAFGTARDGARAYLAVGGGFAVYERLGSASADPVAGFAGLAGRPLAAGDLLDVGTGNGAGERRWPDGAVSSGIVSGGAPVELAVVAGPHLERLPSGFGDEMVGRTWTLSPRCDRAGLRLEGEPLDTGEIDLVSLPMLPGAVQVPPNGLPIVLMPDAPTVGGYPVPAVVAEADRPRTGQLRPGDTIRFDWIDLAEGRRRALEQAERLAAIAASLA